MSEVRLIGPVSAKIMIVGDIPTEQDILRGEPFVGGGGFELSKILAEAGTFREACLMTLIIEDRCNRGVDGWLVAKRKTDITSEHVFYKGKHVLPAVVEGIERLRLDILRYKPNVVVPLGNLALWALTGEWGLDSWRSSNMESTLVPGVKVIPSLNPGRLGPQWSIRPLMVHDFKRVVRESASPEIKRVNYKMLIRPSFAEARQKLKWMLEQCRDPGRIGRMKIAADIETRAGHTACIAFAWTSDQAVCIPLMCQHNPEGYWTESEEAELVWLMCCILREAHIIGQNWNYDAQYNFRHWHVLCTEVEDTMLKQHSCFSNLDKNLAFLSSMYCDDHLYWKDDRTNWTEGPKGEGEDKYWIYNCTDACRTFAINEVLDSVVKTLGVAEVNEFQQALAPAVLQSMIRGVKVDLAERARFNAELTKEIETREAWIAEVLGRPVNIKSPKQLQEVFYKEFGLTPIIDKKTKAATTNDEALHRIAVREPILKPLTRRIAELRSLGVFRSTFVEARLDVDGRLRCSYNIAGTYTYRFASSKDAFGSGLNLQNVPSGGETEDGGLDLPNVRKLFVPDTGMEFFDIDLDSADLRIVTWESDCKWMKQQFAAGRKPYIEIMKEYYQNGDMSKKSHPAEYGMFKALCHGTNYLGTPNGIAPRIGLDVGKVGKIQDWYFGLCPEIRKWQEEVKKQVTGRRFITNVFGYRFHFFDRIEGTIFNQAVAWIPQSTVGCLINRGYLNLYKRAPEVQVLLQVHDSLAGQFPIEGREKHIETVLRETAIPLPYSQPLLIPVGIKTSQKSWGDCE